jgi:LuxR family maltose regulon positive regulatory protein
MAPVLDGSAPVSWPTWLVRAFLLEAAARDALGEPAAAGNAVEHALNLAEPDRALSAFLLAPAPDLLARHARQCTKHVALIAEISRLRPGEHAEPERYLEPTRPRPHPRGSLEGSAPQLVDPISQSESRVLRYLPTNLTASEIAGELFVSVNTVRTHMRHLFAKLGVHRRTEAVDRARALGLLTASRHTP